MTQEQQRGSHGLNRTLSLRNLIILGIVVIQPTAPMGIYGVVSNRAHGHVATTVLIAMIAMLFTAGSYGWMARIYPSAGSAYTYVGRETNSLLGYIVGWGLVMDYLLNPLICTAFCAKAAQNIVPEIPYYIWILLFAGFFTWMNVRGIQTSARVNEGLCIFMTAVVVIFLAVAAHFVWSAAHPAQFFTAPFYDPATFHAADVLGGTSIAVLTYIGFDAVSTLSEEAHNPRRNILLATILVCLLTGLSSAIEVYAAQLVWGSKPFAADQVESAFALLSRQIGGRALYHTMNFTLLIANMGSGMGSQLAAGRILYGMGRGNALPQAFFAAIEPKRRVPRNSILVVGAIAFAGAGLLELFASRLGGGAYAVGAEMLNFGAFLAFMGVNTACFLHYWRQGATRNAGILVVSALGFAICAFIWLHLNRVAMVMGFSWMTLGLIYGFIRTRRSGAIMVQFDEVAE